MQKILQLLFIFWPNITNKNPIYVGTHPLFVIHSYSVRPPPYTYKWLSSGLLIYINHLDADRIYDTVFSKWLTHKVPGLRNYIYVIGVNLWNNRNLDYITHLYKCDIPYCYGLYSKSHILTT